MIHQLGSALICFAISCLILGLTVLVFVKLTRYNDWEQIRSGNLAAALVLGGKVFAVGNVIRFAVVSNNNPLDTLVWGIVGIALQVVVFYGTDWLIPGMRIDNEVEKGNRAAGFLSFAFSIAFSYVIGASIS